MEIDKDNFEMNNEIEQKPLPQKKRHRSSGSFRSAFGSALSAPSEVDLMVDNEDDEEFDVNSTANIFKMSKEKRFLVINFCIANFFLGLFYSILAPFFPTEATKKGISGVMIGLIFGSFELVLILISPIYGSYLNLLGAKFMYIAGIFVCAICAILFGFLDKANEGIEYLTLCFMVRIFEAFGAAGFSVSSFAMMAFNFPKHVATMFGTLEMFTGLGLMVGPPVGGILFNLGGFVCPFSVLGSFLLLVGIISYFLLPYQEVTNLPREGSMLNLLKIPVVMVTGICLICGAACIGYLDVSLAIFLNSKFKLGQVSIGLVFLVAPLSYSIMSPIWGRIVDWKPWIGKYVIFTGYLVGGLAFFFIGPASFFGFSPRLPLVIGSLFFNGLGISTLAITFQIISKASKKAGYSDNLSTYGLIAGLVNSFFSTGAFLGPLGGGYLQDVLGFANASVVIGTITMSAALLLLLFTFTNKYTNSIHKEKNPLLPRISQINDTISI